MEGGSSTGGGGGRKLRALPRNFVFLPWVSKRGVWEVPGILPGCPGPLGVFKKIVQKKFVRIFRSLLHESIQFSWWTFQIPSEMIKGMTLTSFDGPLLGFKKTRSRGKDEKQRQ